MTMIFYESKMEKLEKPGERLPINFRKSQPSLKGGTPTTTNWHPTWHHCCQSNRRRRHDKEKIDYIIVGHNFGDISLPTGERNLYPVFLLKLNIIWALKTRFVWPDLPFGCPGWCKGLSRPITICVREMPNWPWLLSRNAVQGL